MRGSKEDDLGLFVRAGLCRRSVAALRLEGTGHRTRARRRSRIMLMARLQGILAPRADEPTVLLALHARAVEKPLEHGRGMAVGHGHDHVTAIVGQVFEVFFPREVAHVMILDP